MKTRSPIIAGVLISVLVAGSLSPAQPEAQRAVPPKQKAVRPEQKVQEITQVAEQARQAAYASDIRAAVGLIAMAKKDAAREILIKIPPSLRRWEWGHFMELCGPPAWRIELGPDKSVTYHPLESISRALAPEIKEPSENADSEDKDETEEAGSPQASPFEIISDRGGRQGAYLCVLKKEANTDYSALDASQLVSSHDPRVMFSFWSGNYHVIQAGRITPDGSLLLVKGSGCATFSRSPTLDVSIKAPRKRDIEESIYLFPLRESAAEEVVDLDPQDPVRTPWQCMRLAGLGAGTRNAILQLERSNATEERAGSRFTNLAYADHFVRKDGVILVLFNVWNKDWSGEIVEFPSGTVISKFGHKVGGGKPLGLGIYDKADQGGAFNVDGSLVVLCPSGLPGSPPALAEGWPEPDGTAAVFESKSGRHRSTLCLGGRYNSGRHADPVWGFSQDSRMVFQSSMEVAGLENIITVCRVADGTAVDQIPRHLRSIAWSPDSSFIYFVEGNGSALEVVEAATLKKVSSIPGAVKSSAYADYAAMRTASTTDSSRFAIGRLLFANDPTTPLVWLEDDAKAPLGSWLLDALHGASPSNLTLADAALLYWVQQCDKQ